MFRSMQPDPIDQVWKLRHIGLHRYLHASGTFDPVNDGSERPPADGLRNRSPPAFISLRSDDGWFQRR